MQIQIRDLISQIITGEWGEEISGDDGVKIIRTANFTNLGIIDYSKIVLRKIDPEKVAKKKLINGDIIIEKSGGSPNQPVGRVVFFDKDSDETFLCNNFTTILRPDSNKVYPKFLFYQMFIAHIRGRTLKYQNKTTGILNLKLEKYLNETVNIPPIADQIKIAATLTKAETLVKLRKDSITFLDEFLISTFLELFQPFFDKKYLQHLESLCVKITDGTHDTPERLKTGVKFITGKHIRPFAIDFENSDYVTPEVHKEIYRRCNPEFGDILYTNIGVNLGTAAMNTVDYEFSMKNVALLKLNKSLVSPRYIEHVLNLPSRRNRILEINSSGGAQQFLSLGQIKNIEIPVPPIELQNTFAAIVEKAEVIKAQLKSNLLDLESLYGSLSQKAFKGELDLSELEINHITPVSSGGMTDISNLEVVPEEENRKIADKLPTEDKRYGDPFEVDEATARKQGVQFYREWKKLHPKPKKSKITWAKVSTQEVANWVKENYTGYHFTSEMLIRFLTEEHVTQPDYYSSEELKKYPQTNEADDLKSFVFSAINEQNPFLQLEQVFYDAEAENLQLNVTEEDFELIKERSPKERSGIYFTIVE